MSPVSRNCGATAAARSVTFAITLALLLTLVSTTFASAATAQMQIVVDATQLPRKLLLSRISLGLSGDTVSLLYPKWIPGIHGPEGPVQNLCGFVIADDNGKTVKWERDWSDVYRFFVYPDGVANPCDISLSYICNQPSTNSIGVDSHGFPSLAVINWNTVVVYPEGVPIRDIEILLSLVLPSGWQYGTALPFDWRKGDTLIFKPVTFEELIDMPLICGENFRTVEFASTPMAKYLLHVVAHNAEDLPDNDSIFEPFTRLAGEAEALFTRPHFDSYHFLLVLSDTIPMLGLEHRNSSLNSDKSGAMLDPKWGDSWIPYVMPHEFVHAWCGKYRRPTGMNTPDYMRAKNMDLLWVYEGLTQYLGYVLSTRSGFWEPQGFRDHLAFQVTDLICQKGRRWRPLRDTEVANYTLREEPESWAYLRRYQDYYWEGAQIWLEFDARIRSVTNGKRSLDDFCAAFFSRGDPSIAALSFDLEEIVAALNKLADQPWDSLITAKLDQTQTEYEPEAIRWCGYRVGYTDRKSEAQKEYEKLGERQTFHESIGLSVKEGGMIADVVPGSPADKAGLYAGVEIIGVNGKKYSYDRLERAVRSSIDVGKISLLTFQLDTFREVVIDYNGGLRYYTLTPVEGEHDWLSEIIAPKAKE